MIKNKRPLIITRVKPRGSIQQKCYHSLDEAKFYNPFLLDWLATMPTILCWSLTLTISKKEVLRIKYEPFVNQEVK